MQRRFTAAVFCSQPKLDLLNILPSGKIGLPEQALRRGTER
jgi:hypothetical protein